MSVENAPILVMSTNGVPVPSANSPIAGWVRGTPSSLALSATVDVVFDLGPAWDQYTLAQLVYNIAAPSTGVQNVGVSGADTQIYNSARRIGSASNALPGTTYFSVTSSGGPQSIIVKPAGRYLSTQITNADAVAALGVTSAVTCIVYPN